MIVTLPGLTNKVQIEFETDVSLGSDLSMSCLWEEHDSPKTVNWYFINGSLSTLIWTFIGDGDGPIEAERGFNERISSRSQASYVSQHDLVLMYVNERDEGDYYCEVIILNNTYTSPPKQLQVNGMYPILMLHKPI